MPCKANRCREGREPCPERATCYGFESTDPPITTPEEGADWTVYALAALAFVICICAVMAALAFKH